MLFNIMLFSTVVLIMVIDYKVEGWNKHESL